MENPVTVQVTVTAGNPTIIDLTVLSAGDLLSGAELMGLQWRLGRAGLAFGGTGRGPRGIGRVAGRVSDDRGHGVGDVAVVLEEVAIMFARSDGTFELRGVEPGRQTVRIDGADFTFERRERPVIFGVLTTGQ